MQSQSGLSSSVEIDGHRVTLRRRRYYRHLLPALAYVRLDHANGGIIRNLSEWGMAIRAVGRLRAGEIVQFRFELLKPRIRVEASGQVAWADATGQAGLRFTDLPAWTHQQLKNWLFTDLLAAAAEMSLTSAPIFSSEGRALSLDGLIVSCAPVATIPIAPLDSVLDDAAEAEDEKDETELAKMPLRFSWWPANIAARTFARFVDGLILVSAVLLFAVVAVEMTGVFPSWLGATGLALSAGCLFGLTYWCLFTALTGTTLGWHLAKLAAEDTHWNRQVEDDVPRFR